MSELSTGLRKHYETALAHQGGNDTLIVSVLIYFALCYGVSHFFSDTSYQAFADIGLLVAIFFYHKHQRSEEVDAQRAAARAMPDDRLATAYTEHKKSSQRTGLLWGVAIIAIALGLLFTPQGNIILSAALVEINHGVK